MIIKGRCKNCGMSFRDFYNMTGKTVECPFCYAAHDVRVEIVAHQKRVHWVVDLVGSEFDPRDISKHPILNKNQISNNPVYI